MLPRESQLIDVTNKSDGSAAAPAKDPANGSLQDRTVDTREICKGSAPKPHTVDRAVQTLDTVNMTDRSGDGVSTSARDSAVESLQQNNAGDSLASTHSLQPS